MKVNGKWLAKIIFPGSTLARGITIFSTKLAKCHLPDIRHDTSTCVVEELSIAFQQYRTKFKVTLSPVTCEFLWDANFVLSSRSESFLLSYFQALTDSESPVRVFHWSNAKELLTQETDILSLQNLETRTWHNVVIENLISRNTRMAGRGIAFLSSLLIANIPF